MADPKPISGFTSTSSAQDGDLAIIARGSDNFKITRAVLVGSAGNDTSGTSASAFGYNNTASGDYASAVGRQNIASGNYSSAFGAKNTASGSYFATACGYSNTAGDYGTAVGDRNVASGLSSSAIGQGNTAAGDYSNAFGNHNTASGDKSTACGYNNTASVGPSVAVGYQNQAIAWSATACGYNNVASDYGTTACGYFNEALGNQSTAIGCSCIASADQSTAIGFSARANIPLSIHMGGAIIVRKDIGAGDPINAQLKNYSGVTNIILGKETNLAVVADQTLTLQTGSTFYVDEVGLIITAADTVSVQPFIHFGFDATPQGVLANVQTTALTALYDRQKFSSLLIASGKKVLTAGVATGATATSMKGRFYWKGILVEDQ